MNKIIDYYNKLLEPIPNTFRIIIAVVVVLILLFAVVKFFRKNFIWIIIFLLLLPAAYPSLKIIWAALSNLIQKIPK